MKRIILLIAILPIILGMAQTYMSHPPGKDVVYYIPFDQKMDKAVNIDLIRVFSECIIEFPADDEIVNKIQLFAVTSPLGAFDNRKIRVAIYTEFGDDLYIDEYGGMFPVHSLNITQLEPEEFRELKQLLEDLSKDPGCRAPE